MLNRIRQWLRQARRVHQTTSTPTPAPHTAPTASTPQTAPQGICACGQPTHRLLPGIYASYGAHGVTLRTGDGR